MRASSGGANRTEQRMQIVPVYKLMSLGKLIRMRCAAFLDAPQNFRGPLVTTMLSEPCAFHLAYSCNPKVTMSEAVAIVMYCLPLNEYVIGDAEIG